MDVRDFAEVPGDDLEVALGELLLEEGDALVDFLLVSADEDHFHLESEELVY